jgi:hypothetical protein
VADHDESERAVMVLSDYYDDAERAFGRASVDRMARALAKYETQLRAEIAAAIRAEEDTASTLIRVLAYRHAATIAEGRTP